MIWLTGGTRQAHSFRSNQRSEATQVNSHQAADSGNGNPEFGDEKFRDDAKDGSECGPQGLKFLRRQPNWIE